MLKSRLLGAVGIMAVVGVMSGVLPAQTPATQASNEVRLAVLPDNPCELLTRAQVAVATGLDITAMARVPDIHQVVDARRAGREPEPGTICSYNTRGEFGGLTIVVPIPADRTAASYQQARERAFTPHTMAQVISGIGADAWSSGQSVHVLTRQGEYFMVVCQKCGGRSAPDQLVALARAVMGRLR